MIPDAGLFIREARLRNGTSQETLARRACTTQKQISRIERGDISPSVSTLSRLLTAMGERLELRAAAVERDVPGAGPFWFSGFDDLIAIKVAARGATRRAGRHEPAVG
ncbi:MAG: helix-turn-helix domain-containing protein [Solirubrobacteraceae bacterium]